MVVVGAGAAGLFCAIFAARSAPGRRVLVLDGARTLGAKILVAGGGRCNVTHDAVDERAYCGSSAHAIRKVLRRFPVARTVDFFREIGVDLKREETGKLFPTTDDARTVLHALLSQARVAGVTIEHPRRVTRIARIDRAGSSRFEVSGEWGTVAARSLVLATGGRSLPKSGSDGAGYEFATLLGHAVTSRVTPALVPLVTPAGHFLQGLSGISVVAEVQVRSSTSRKIASQTGPVLCTHFGLSGPAILDISRHLIHARLDDPNSGLVINWLPGETFESLDQALVASRSASLAEHLRSRLPSRFIEGVCGDVGVSASVRANQVEREARRRLVRQFIEMEVPVVGDRGYNYAEVTAGGVPLDEIHLDRMESRCCPGLFLCGEICDVDGRIGGYNFQWAWSSGHVAGVSV